MQRTYLFNLPCFFVAPCACGDTEVHLQIEQKGKDDLQAVLFELFSEGSIEFPEVNNNALLPAPTVNYCKDY